MFTSAISRGSCKAIAALALVSACAAGAANSSTEQAASLPVGTCVNMGNSLEPPEESAWGGKPITAEDFVRIKAAGFQTVRIPVRWHRKSLSDAPYTIDAVWMTRVAEVVDQALAADLNVILNSHHFDPIHEDPAGISAWHGGVWTQIAQRFAEYPEDRLWFELENEPHNKFGNENLLQTLDPAYRAVRATNPTRPVIYGGGNWSDVNSLASLPMPDDPNVYPTFHYYEPFDYTHQGASWVQPEPPRPGRKYGSQADRERLESDVTKVERYIARTGKIPFMGETGAYDLHSPTSERVVYHKAVREAFEPLGVGICVWGYANTFPFWDHETGAWIPGILAAMGLQPETDTPATEQAQSRAKKGLSSNLPEQLRAIDTALPGQLINDPSRLDWDSYGDQARIRGYSDPEIPGGGAALKINVRRAGNTYDAGLSVPLIMPVAEGETVTVGFYARALSDEGAIAVRFQKNAPPYPGFGESTVMLTPEWKWHEASATASRDLSSKDGIVAFQFGDRKQSIEIGQTIVVKGAASIAAN